MPLAELVDQYGYAAVFVGSLLEGETILLLAGIAANAGYYRFGQSSCWHSSEARSEISSCSS